MTSKSQHVVFRLKNELYALNIHHIQEIIKLKEICETPTSKRPYLKGVINVRGTIIPVISLNERFNRTDEEPTRTSRIVITENEQETIGILVDEIIKAELLEIEPLPETANHTLKDYCEGISYLGSSIVTILRLSSVLEMGEE